MLRSIYGREDCKHEWRRITHGKREHGCWRVVCIQCGAITCLCEIDNTSLKVALKKKTVLQNANLNGKWNNPYCRIPKYITKWGIKLDEKSNM